MSHSEAPFRVVVVGGGVSGLAASHIFQKAGIDHVVLERRSTVAPQAGASIAMYPNGSRILHQVGALETVKSHTVPMGRWRARLPSGKEIINGGMFRYLEENLGSGLLFIERRQFLQDLYDTLPDKSYIKTNSGVEDVIEDENGVEVRLSNGEVERGDLVLGCDGVYSPVRTIMWDHANRATPGLITTQEKMAIKAEWKCIVLMTENIPEMGLDLNVVHNDNYSHLYIMRPEAGYFFVHFKLDEPVTYPNRSRYTDEDMEKLANSIANHPMSDTLVFGEVWKRRIRASIVNLEEGVLDHWYHGRIVLAGDSAHKTTPNIALGGNTCIESVAVLTNKLQAVLAGTPRGSKPTAAALEGALAAYQAERLGRMRLIAGFAGDVTRMQAWASPWLKFMATRVVPRLPDRYFADQLSDVISAAPKLDFLDVADFPSGRVPWKDAGGAASVAGTKGGAALVAKPAGNANGKGGVGLLLSAATAFVLVFYYAFRFLFTARP